jgi:hypothetical protein
MEERVGIVHKAALKGVAVRKQLLALLRAKALYAKPSYQVQPVTRSSKSIST